MFEKVCFLVVVHSDVEVVEHERKEIVNLPRNIENVTDAETKKKQENVIFENNIKFICYDLLNKQSERFVKSDRVGNKKFSIKQLCREK